jgi:hypothetical protein
VHRAHQRHIQLLSKKVALGARHRRWLYAALLFVWLTGLSWIMVHFAPGSGGGDDSRRGYEAWALRLHGAAAFAFLVAMGSMFTHHIPRAWYLGRNVASGLWILAFAAVLVLTGYALYYFATDESHAWWSAAHWVVGIAAAALVPIHVWLGRRERTRLPDA